jgi:lipid A disaccharide synthetase
LVAVLPGSRRGEAARHLPALLGAVTRLARERAVQAVLPALARPPSWYWKEKVGTPWPTPIWLWPPAVP